ncbi:MAG: hypothetical protein ABJF23_13110 [Bryobacteraceae bacterium]
MMLSRTEAAGVIEFKTDSLVYGIGSDGLNHSLRDRLGNRDYLKSTSAFMSIEKDGRRTGSNSVSLHRGVLSVKFGDTGIEAKVRVKVSPSFLTFELASLSDHSVSIVELANLPLTLDKYVSKTLASARNDEYAIAVVPLNMKTHSKAARAVLTVEGDSRVLLEGTGFALVGCPTPKLLDRIERIELDYGLPHPTLNGIWARRSPEQERSYLFCDLKESTADAMINYAKVGGFGSVVVYGGTWNATHGSYGVNLLNFPGGERGLKEVSRKIHTAGLKFGMHNLEMLVDKTDPLVSPVPATGFMMYPDRRRILGADVSPGDTFLPTTTSPLGLLGKNDKSRFHCRDLRIGDEIITYDDLKTSPPYGFTACLRGAHGTRAASHPAGSPIENFSEFVGSYRPDVTSDLYDRVARSEAASLDKYGFDYIYPDGTGENLGYWPTGPEWYIYNLQISKLFGYTKREVLWAHAPITDYSWHIFSRGNTTDTVHTGMIQHFDRVSVAGAKASFADLQPFEFGWFGYFAAALDAQATRPREMVYAWSKALAYRAAMSLETDKAALDGNGRTREIFSRIANWEALKQKAYFPPRIRDQLKAAGAEFELERTGNGRWQILPVTYFPEKYVAGEDEWTLENGNPDQPLRITIDAMPSLAPFGDRGNISLLDPQQELDRNTSGNGPLGSPSRQTEGLSFDLKSEEDGFHVMASNKGSNPSGWGCAELILDGPRDLRENRALGTWVTGDGSGAFLHFVIEDSSRWPVRDYYVRLDFKGRRYVEMREAAKGEIYDFVFPFNNYWAIRNIDIKTISRVYVFLTGVPSGAAVDARFSRLEALREQARPVKDANLTINGKSVSFPANLQTGWYLEYLGSGEARVFNANGFEQPGAGIHGTTPVMRHGSNKIHFQCGGCGPAKLTISTRGEPLR